MINIVMLARNRKRLTEQALWSIHANTKTPYSLTFIDDDSDEEYFYTKQDDNWTYLRVEGSDKNLGKLKNLGVYWSERMFGRGEWLAVLDNDVAIIDPRWVERVTFHLAWEDKAIIGGCRHPFHQYETYRASGFNATEKFLVTDAVAGYSHFMNWNTWDRFGPYVETGGAGVNRSEDYALCRKAVDSGLAVGYIDPPVLTHTGITNSDGQPAVGSEHFLRVPGVLYE